MADNEFNFYNSENDGYRGGFGDYADPGPSAPASGPEAPKKRPGGLRRRMIALALARLLAGAEAASHVKDAIVYRY